MSCGASRGALARLAIGGQSYRFVRFQDMSNIPSTIDVSQGTTGRGSYFPHSDDMIDGEKVIRCQVFMQPTPAELATLLPWLGFSVSTITWTPKATFASMHFTMDLDLVAGMYTRANSIIAKYAFVGQRGRQPWGLQLEIWSKTEADLGSWTATAISSGTVATRPMAFHQGTLSLAGVSRELYRCALAVDFHVESEAYNSQNVQDLCPTSWDVTLAAAVPFKTANEALYSDPRDADTRIAGVLTTSATGISTSYTLPSLKALPKLPDVLARNEGIKLATRYQAAFNGTDPIITIVHDFTP